MRYRITVRGLGIELRGFMDQLTDEDAPTVAQLAEAMEPFGLVVASEAEDSYNPFEATADTSLELILSFLAQQEYPNLPDLIRTMANVHYMQANVIQGERALRESAEAELRDRELHHFETEQENMRLKANLEQERAEHESTLNTGRSYMLENDVLRADHTESEKALIDQVNKQRDVIERIITARSNHPDLPVCEKYPDPEDFVKCGWRSAVEDIDKVLAEVPE